jgi:hypothetical protein
MRLQSEIHYDYHPGEIQALMDSVTSVFGISVDPQIDGSRARNSRVRLPGGIEPGDPR